MVIWLWYLKIFRKVAFYSIKDRDAAITPVGQNSSEGACGLRRDVGHADLLML